ncbi:SPOR domain-containing protein [Martelella limonii]|uniref:SPOR domain-containing protein n=1 Tax=Martelella limonii TaxID=1647649 RepID=UPI00157FDB04|nr:SPOR domain-containing protein [Martelella limonii]
MADKKKPDHGNDGAFELDDPFAELARLIAPRDEEPVFGQTPEVADDLTDELLREFNSFPDPQRPSEPHAETHGAHPESEPPFGGEQSYQFEDFEAVEPQPASIWDELPAEPVGEEEPSDAFFLSELRDTLSTHEPQRAPEPYETPYDQPYLADGEPDDARAPAVEPEEVYLPDPVYTADPDYTAETDYRFETVAEQPAPLDEQELDLDLDEIALELSEIDLPDEGPGPLDDVPESGADNDDDFDPAALISTDEVPQPVDELDLPRMSDDEVVPVRPSPDPYDFDLDEELADVLATKPALVDPLQEPEAESETLEEPLYGRSGETEAYERAFAQAAAAQTVFQQNASAYESPADEEYFEIDEREPRRSMLPSTYMRAGRIALIAGGVVVIGVLAVFAGMRYFAGGAGGEPVVITADNSSFKEAPEDPGGEVVPNQDNAVFNDVSGTLAEAPRQGSLIASDQQPTDVETVAPNPLAESANAGANQAVSGGLEPRKVRTMIVRPDGTLVERGAASLSPSSSQTAQDTASENGQTAGDLASAGQADGATSLAPPTGEAATGSTGATSLEEALAAADDTVAATGTAEEPATTEEPATADVPVEDFGIANVPVPTRRPAGSAPARVAAATPAATATQAPAATSAPAAAAPVNTQPTSAYAMQVASLPSQQEAEQAYRRLSAQYPAIFGRRSVEIVPAAIAGKGTYYRVRVPASSLSEALSLCESFKAQGGSCFVPR